MHSRVEIIKNQKEFSYNIKKDLKKDFFNSKKELEEIETKDVFILNEKKNLEKRFEKIKIEKEISAFFINEKNIYPKFYAWWDRESEKVEILLYETR
jgi:hypothetical protein|tara:strand:- start:222 stop:512 length:291 start_codon:yes stop_codon:yes gene_type:complete